MEDQHKMKGSRLQVDGNDRGDTAGGMQLAAGAGLTLASRTSA